MAIMVVIVDGFCLHSTYVLFSYLILLLRFDTPDPLEITVPVGWALNTNN